MAFCRLLLLLSVLSVGSAASADAPPTEEPAIALLLAEVRRGEGAFHVHAWLELPERPPQAVDAPLLLRLRAVRSVGSVAGAFERTVAPGDGAAPLKVHGNFSLTPGAYTLELSAWVGDRKLVERRFPYALAPVQTEHAAVLPPFFIDDFEEHTVLRESTAKEAVDPFVTAGGETFVPVVVPVLPEGTTRARVTVVGYRLTEEKNLLEARLFTADGSLLGKDRLGLVAQSETAPDGLDRMDFSLGTQGLAPGDYQLEVSIQDLEHGRTDQALMPFRIERYP